MNRARAISHMIAAMGPVTAAMIGDDESTSLSFLLIGDASVIVRPQ